MNDEILQSFDEEQIYRIDHYLGKDMIQSLLPLKFANPAFKHLWNKDFISNMQVTLAEDIGVEDRGGYYETSGALRDMVQNHILQIVSFLFMDEPASLQSDDIAIEKVKALKSLKMITPENINEKFVRGQYAISADEPRIVDYLSEPNVNTDSTTETFVAGKVESSNEKWTGVPIYIRTGKRMKDKETRIDIVFKNDASNLYAADELTENILSIHVGSNQGISLQINNKVVGHNFDIAPTTLDYKVNEQTPDDYEKLLLNALQGNKTSFVYWEEVAYSWKYIDQIREAWDADASNLVLYPVNSNGPKEAFDLLEKDGHYWIW